MKIKDYVWWRHRSGIGHGRIHGIDLKGPTTAKTRFLVHEFDHHKGEKNILKHWGSALHVTTKKNLYNH